MNNLESTLVETNERPYRIRKQKESHRYPVTAPTNILTSSGVKHKDDVGFSIEINNNGRVFFLYSSDLEGLLTVSVSHYDNTGELRIPGSIGAVLKLNDEEIQWSVREFPDSSRIIVGKSTKFISEANTKGTLLGNSHFKHITQNIEKNEKSWSQEQFRMYLNTEMLSSLGWASNQRVELSLKHLDGKPIVEFSPTDSTEKHKTQKAGDTGSGQVDATLNLPIALSRSLNFVNAEFELTSINSSLSLHPSKRWNPVMRR